VSHTPSTPPPAATGSAALPSGAVTMWLDERYLPHMEEAGLTHFDAVMQTQGGRCLRALADRENWRLELHAPHDRLRGAYLKKHHIRTPLSWLRAKLGAGPGQSPGSVEARNVADLTARGVPVMELLAYGQKLRRDGLQESFVLTHELEGYAELQQFVRKRFARLDAQPAHRDRELMRLLRQTADVARRLHEAGYNHRDLYCCHFFVREPAAGRFEIKLIDLQRVQHRRWFRRRWVVKDLAQLAWSAPSERIKCTHRLAFIRQYLGVKKLRPRDKRLIRAVLAKQQIMQRRLGVEACVSD